MTANKGDELACAQERIRALEDGLSHLNSVVDRLLTAVESMEQDVGSETPAYVLLELGPAYDRAKKLLSAASPDPVREDLVEALRKLERSASEVSALGAATGPQWSRLTSATLKARAALRRAEEAGR